MFDDASFGPRALANPGILQSAALNEIQARLGGTYVIADPNNGFSILSEMASSCTAQFSRALDARLDAIYPVRAQSAQDLYAFMSDLDYVNLTASPCELMVVLVLGRQELIDKSVSFNKDYNAVIIPQTTVFTVGSRKFGLYYPIQILINKITNVFTVLYDLSVSNPLMPMSSNIPYAVTEYTQAGNDMISMVFPIYQFATTIKNEAIPLTTGWSKTYTYTDQFYAARVFTYVNNNWVEMTYTLSQMAYDPTIPTAILTLDEDVSTISVQIPQIYFTNNQIGSQLKIYFYTTQGALNESIPVADAASIQVNFDVSSSAYAAALNQPSIFALTPYQQTSLVGGANAMPFATLRERVISGTLYDITPVNNIQLTAVAKKYGFTLTKYIDNIDTRIYFAGAPLTTTDQRIVPLTVNGILINSSVLGGDPSTILKFDDGLVTILPNTLFQYSSTTSLSTPLSNAQVNRLKAMTVSDYVTEMNTQIYTQQPFHIVLNTNAKYPQAITYNLMNPVMTSLLFIKENVNSAAQMTITNAEIVHNAQGVGGYTITMGVKRSNAIINTDPTYFKVVLMAQSQSDTNVAIEAQYMSTDSSTGLDLYSVYIPMNYHISEDDYFEAPFGSLNGAPIVSAFPLTTTFDVRLMVAQSLYPSVVQDALMAQNLPSTYNTYLVTTQQSMTIQFGQNLSNVIYNITDTTWGTTVYATWPTDVAYTYPADVYMTDAQGNFIHRITTINGVASVHLVKLHSKGDAVYSGQNISVSLTQSYLTNATTLSVSSVSGVLIGSLIYGLGIAVGTTITAINGSVLTLSQPTTAANTLGATITIDNQIVTTTLSQASATGSKTLTLTSTAHIVPGMVIYGLDFAPGTTVTAVTATTVTVSATTATSGIAAGTVVTFLNPNGPLSYQHRQGSIRTDANNLPIETSGRQNVYRVTALQIDARLYASQAANDVAYINTLPQTITQNALALNPIRNELLEQTYLYYTPNRTMGLANFSTGNNATMQYNLGVSLTLVFYVSEAVRNNTDLCALIQTQTLSLLSTYMTTNTLISTNDIGTMLKTAFVGTVDAIDVSGLDNLDSVKTLCVAESGVQMSLAYILTVEPDGTTSMQPNVTMSFMITPTT